LIASPRFSASRRRDRFPNRRGPAAQRLVQGLLDHAQSTCTIRSSARILARQKDPGLFDKIIRLLPGDTRMVFAMDIAGALEELGDPRAVHHLVRVLDPEQRGPVAPPSDVDKLFDRTMNRARSALALGAFEDPAAKAALQRGLDHPELGAYCAAALYRLTREPQRLQAVRTALVAGADRHWALVAYLRKINDPQARALADEVEQRAQKRAKE
jgi:HEAT repeat protein